ncbi:putative ADP-ribosylation factor GTPase activating protein [Leishmania braziliensis MHOM/BR/75/M2904]|uniref:ADP-ribosylation factor GTPase activating protein n=2 Tax=Leishmania braziliensis TaxID=5660 RepID=A4HPI1_LEIBR|nr:putative ADP-ribosylation factor GTPase activating protein [Leishmania braziliensis MHOM/BR/75/M2904]CAJ2481610.1 unnamed protein product [Leishmania braziliensis]CAM44089.2 putative ADP-ribosylation factor GTPase activating protein [Leishmania braziliensis MHOM/BR/75/M2904]
MNIRQRKSERHKEALRKLSQIGGNKSCFDCGMRGPLYVVSDFGILVCSGCSAVHRSFQHKVKGITMSEFTDDEIARFAVSGNDRARNVWLSTFRDQLPRPGDVIALKTHVRSIFEERRCWNAQEFSALQKLWDHPNEPPSQVPPPLSMTRPTAFSLAPAREVPTAQPGPVSAATAPAPPSSAAAPPTSSAPAPSVRPPQDDIFDCLFAAPVQSPSEPQPTAHAAVATASPMTASHAPIPPARHQPATVTSIVGDLFAGVPPPVVQPAGGYSALYPQKPQQQQQSMDFPVHGTRCNFTQGPPSNIMTPPPLQSSQLPYQQQQPQQDMIVFSTSGAAAPYSAPAQSHNHNLNSVTPSTTVYPSASGAAPQAYQPSPFSSNPPPQQEGWSAPSFSSASPSSNINRIVVLSVTKQQNDRSQNSQSK